MCLETQTLSKTGWDRIRTGNHSSRIGTGTHQDWDHCTGTGHLILSHGCTVVYSGVQWCTVCTVMYSRVQSCLRQFWATVCLVQAILGVQSCPGNSGHTLTILGVQPCPVWAILGVQSCLVQAILGVQRTVKRSPQIVHHQQANETKSKKKNKSHFGQFFGKTQNS